MSSLQPPVPAGAPATAAAVAGPTPRRISFNRNSIETRVFGWLRWLVIVFFVLFTALPFYYMLMLSVRSIESVAFDPGALIVSVHDFTLSSYAAVFRSVAEGGQGFLEFIRNSAIVALATVVLSLGIAIPGAYAISRLEFFGRRQIHFFFLAIYLFPSILLAIPLFVIFSKIGFRGSLIGLVIVYASQTVAVTIHMLRNYFNSVPVSLEEAAATDGATRLQIIWKISLPLARPAIMATGLFVFMIAWNEFLFALLFLVDHRELWTVSLGLSQLAGSIEVAKTTLIAGSVVLTLPIVVLFFLSERFLVAGLTAGAEKG